MVKQYSEVFKKQAVNLLSELNSKGQVKVNKKLVKNVRELYDALNVSPYALYQWRKKITPKKPKVEDKKKKKSIKKEKKVTPGVKKEEVKEEVVSEVIIPSGDSGVFSGRFVGYIASNMSIPNYSRTRLKEVQFKVGMEYIKKSGISLEEVK